MEALLSSSGPVEGDVSRTFLAVIERLAALVQADNQHLLALALRSTKGNYLHAHCVNVSILSLRTAARLDWRPEFMRRLGLAAILHGSGMRRWLHLALLKRRLSGEERSLLKGYAAESIGLLEQIAGLDPDLRRAVSEIISWVRSPSAQRPPGFNRQSADIIALCEAYEALSHPRSWRRTLLPHEAVKAVVKLPHDQYDPELIRIFIGQLTLYPPGTYVRLESNEIGRVVRVDPESPTRPIVRVFINAEGRRLRMPWFIDLKQQPLMHIRAAVDEAGLDTEDAKLRAMFLADRWWGA